MNEALKDLTEVFKQLSAARRRWCAEVIDGAEEMWSDIPEMLDAIVPKMEAALALITEGTTEALRAHAQTRIAVCRRDEEDGAALRKRQAEHGWVSPASRERLWGVRVERETWEAVLSMLDGGSP